MRPRLSYANVIATLALFIALGGSSYAALRPPRNSVGAAQIRTGAVHSSERRRRLAAAARPQQRRASDARRRRRQGLLRARGRGREGRPRELHLRRARGTGHDEVGFSQAPSQCAWTAALGTVDDTEPPAGRITVHQDGDHVGVQTYDAAGNPASLPFDVIMAC